MEKFVGKVKNKEGEKKREERKMETDGMVGILDKLTVSQCSNFNVSFVIKDV